MPPAGGFDCRRTGGRCMRLQHAVLRCAGDSCRPSHPRWALQAPDFTKAHECVNASPAQPRHASTASIPCACRRAEGAPGSRYIHDDEATDLMKQVTTETGRRQQKWAQPLQPAPRHTRRLRKRRDTSGETRDNTKQHEETRRNLKHEETRRNPCAFDTTFFGSARCSGG